jgi:hypothetical protein
MNRGLLELGELDGSSLSASTFRAMTCVDAGPHS